MTQAAAELAARWLASGQEPGAGALPDMDGAGRLALAWALKTECHKAWNTAPGQAALAARWLALLARADADADTDATAPPPGGGEPDVSRQILALARWTAGLSALVGGEMAQSLAALEEASAHFEAIGQPLFAAQAGVPQLIALSMLGRHDEAISRAGEVRACLAAGGDLHAAGKVDLNRGSMLLRLDRYAQAAQSYRQAAVAFARVADVEHSVMADIGLAATLSCQFEFDEAARMLARARQRASAHQLPVLEGLARGELGQLALHRGERSIALREFEAARALLAGRAHPQRLIEADRALADACLGLRLLPEARRLHAAVAEAALALHAPVEAAWARLQLAQTLLLLGQPAAADEALALAQAGFAEHGNAIGQARADLLQARCKLAEPGAALRLARSAATTFAGAQAIGWRIEAECVAAQALAALGLPQQAAALLDRLCADAERAGALPQRPACEMARAELAEQCGDTHLAQRHYACAAALFEHLRSLLPPGELRVASAFDTEQAADALVRLAAPACDGPALLQRMEDARARSLHEHWRDAPAGNPPDMAGLGAANAGPDGPAGTAARARLNWLYQRWQQALLAGPAQASRAAEMLAQVRVAELEWQAQRRQRLVQAAQPPAVASSPARPGAAERTSFPNSARNGARTTTGTTSTTTTSRTTSRTATATPSASASLDTAALQHALGASRALLVYHLDGEHWRACLVQPQGVRSFEGRLTGLATTLNQLRFQLGAMRQPGAGLQRHAAQLLARTRQLLRKLHDELLPAALLAAVGEVAQLVIVPHRGLHALPWAALAPGEQDGLLQRCELVTAPSATTWLHCHRRAALPMPAGEAKAGALVMGFGGLELPAVEREARAVARVLGEDTRLLLGNAASTAHFHTHAASAGVLHLACHATCRADNPDFSALHLSDGVVTAADAGELRLRARLVTLSACDTALSRVAPGDEVLGLARGFLMAGAPSVVASLWSVEDGSTAELMTAFYGARQQGLGVAASLRKAQLALAATHPHPFFWAPFVVCGHG